ncbi:rRNA-processing protein [Seiridium cupressi]
MPIPPTVYQDVIDWALSQQQHEAASGQAAPLTPTQRKALLELHQCVKPAAPPPSEPELGDTDWISLLHRYRQANPTPSGVNLSFTEKPAEEALAHQQRWFVHVSLDEHNEPFPLADPSAPGPGVPSFGRKKDGKQYAAKCAVEWLMEQGHMPTNGKDVSFGKQKLTSVVLPSSKRQKVGAFPPPPATTSSSASASVVAAQPVKSAPGESVSEPASASAGPKSSAKKKSPDPDQECSAVKQVSQLCTSLNIQPPRYKVNRESGEFWSGFPELGSGFEGNELPPKLGHVTDVYGGKESAKEAVAAELLKELRKIEAERMALFEDLVKDQPPVTS